MRHPADSSDAVPASEPKAGTALPSIHVANVASASSSTLAWRSAVAVFLTFAFAYFLSALVRAVTATLAPTLAQEFALQARDLGLLAGGYFLGFAAMQLPLGRWLDRHGPRKVSLGFLGVAVLGCLVFSQATGFTGLLAGRVLCGAGLLALHQTLNGLRGDPDLTLSTPADVLAGAQAQPGSMAQQAVSLFCGFLGSVAGDLALTLGARGGVYIGGGIVPRLGERFNDSPFRARFEAKGRFAAYLQAIPTWVIDSPVSPALEGASQALTLNAPSD